MSSSPHSRVNTLRFLRGARFGAVQDPAVGHALGGPPEFTDASPVGTGSFLLIPEPHDHPQGPVHELLEGPDGPTWAERLVDAGVSPLLRRHPVLVRASVVTLAAALLVGGSLVAYGRGQPPDDDGVIAVRVFDATLDASDDTNATSATVERPSFGYSLIPRRRGETMRLLGVEGPGVFASEVETAAPDVAARTGADVVVTVAPQCADPALARAQESAYHLRVQRTDAAGRTVIGLVDVLAGSNVQWSWAIARSCAQLWFGEMLSLEQVEVTSSPADPDGPALLLRLHLRSAVPRGVQVSYGYWSPPPEGAVNSVTVPGGATAVLRVTLALPDCREAPWPDLGLHRGIGLAGEILPTPPNLERRVGGSVGVAWSEGFQRRIEAQVRAMCAAMPALSVGVVSSRPAVNTALVQSLNAGSWVAVLRTTLRITSPADHVTVSDTTSASQTVEGIPPSITRASAALPGGTAVVAVDWATPCASAAAPPTLRVVLTSHGRTWPARVALDSGVVAAALEHACPELGLTGSALRDSGWKVSR